MKSFVRSMLFVAAAGGAATAQPAPGSREVLTLERAVQLAEQQQPALRQSRAAVEAARGRIESAQVSLYPTATLAATATTGSSRVRPCVDDPGRNCGGFFDPTGSTGLSAQASWVIYDFGQRRAAIRAAELSAEATAAAVTASVLDVRTNVEIAYLEAVARQRLIGVAEATVKSEEQHLDQARRFVAAQAKDPIEVVQAQARAANARSTLAQAQSANAIALANLRAAIGWVDASRQPIPDPSWPTPPNDEPPALVALVEIARKDRPEILQLDRQIAAADASYDAARYRRRPALSANASSRWDPGSSDWTPEPSWVAGLTLSWELFDGGRARAEQRIARANVTSAEAQRDALLVSLTAQLQLAEARYAQGLGSQIELADAQTAITTAEGNLVQAEWQLADAWAQLRRALGQR